METRWLPAPVLVWWRFTSAAPLLSCEVCVQVHSPMGDPRLSTSRPPPFIPFAQDEPPNPSWLLSPACGLQDVPVHRTLHLSTPPALSRPRASSALGQQ